ncbi:MAG: MoaD/ThiS family protein [Candidatus Kariarchaeaceae archaeon]|jgi:MoaD family protein
MTIRITIRSFAMIREVIGDRRVELELTGSTVGEALDILVDRYPDLKTHLQSSEGWSNHFIYILNEEKLDRGAMTGIGISDGDEITILPPAGGGLKN